MFLTSKANSIHNLTLEEINNAINNINGNTERTSEDISAVREVVTIELFGTISNKLIFRSEPMKNLFVICVILFFIFTLILSFNVFKFISILALL